MTPFKILFANLYDVLLLVAIWFAASIPFVLLQGEAIDSQPGMTLAFQFFLLAVTYAYLTFFWTQSGQTPGLRTWKCQLVTVDNHLLSRHDANLRFLLTVLLFLVGWIGLFFPGQQLLQDRLAKTKIIFLKEPL